MKLGTLNPRFEKSEIPCARKLVFMCPGCRLMSVSIDVWDGRPCEIKFKDNGSEITRKVWHEIPSSYKEWKTFSAIPAVEVAHAPNGKCLGWNGKIRNGVCSVN